VPIVGTRAVARADSAAGAPGQTAKTQDRQTGRHHRARFTGIPAVLDRSAHDGSTIGRLAADAEMDAVFAVPFIHAGQSKAAIAWCF